MTTIQTDRTNPDGSPKSVNVMGVWRDTMPEDDFYELMTADKNWTHSDTFIGDIMVDSNTPARWKIEAHDLAGSRAKYRCKTWDSTVYVWATRQAWWS